MSKKVFKIGLSIMAVGLLFVILGGAIVAVSLKDALDFLPEGVQMPVAIGLFIQWLAGGISLLGVIVVLISAMIPTKKGDE